MKFEEFEEARGLEEEEKVQEIVNDPESSPQKIHDKMVEIATKKKKEGGKKLGMQGLVQMYDYFENVKNDEVPEAEAGEEEDREDE